MTLTWPELCIPSTFAAQTLRSMLVLKCWSKSNIEWKLNGESSEGLIKFKYKCWMKFTSKSDQGRRALGIVRSALHLPPPAMACSRELAKAPLRSQPQGEQFKATWIGYVSKLTEY